MDSRQNPGPPRWQKIAPHPAGASSRGLSPRGAEGAAESSHGRSGSKLPSEAPNKRKRSTVRSACDACRKRKVACDGEKPQCAPCRKRNIKCIYSIRDNSVLAPEESELRRQGRDAAELLDLLRTVPHDESLTVLQKIRAGTAPVTLLPLLRDRFGKSTQDSEPSTQSRGPRPSIFSHLPPSATGLEFELNMRHQIAYPTLFPIDTASIDEDTFLRPTVSRGLSPVSEAQTSLMGATDGTRTSQERETERSSTLTAVLSHRASPSVALSDMSGDAELSNVFTIRSSALCDDRLLRLDISRWTNVIVSNDYAARAISLYLETDHLILGLFDADLFLENLINFEPNFCSRLLVSSLLSFAFQGYFAINPDSYALSQSFYYEAIKLWEVESSKPTLTAASAAQYISLSAEAYGEGDVGKHYYKEGLEMGKKMGLFDSETEERSAKSWLDHHIDWIRAASHTAWGIFCRSSLHCLHSKSGHINVSPLLPIPGEAVSSALVGGTSEQPFGSYSVPVYMKWTFNYLCKLWKIAQKFIWEYYDGEERSAADDKASSKFAEGILFELLEWASSLPLELARGDHNDHGVVLLHIYFHAIILDVFRPFLNDDDRSAKLSIFTTHGSTPLAVYGASVKQLKRLVLVYWTTFPPASYSMFSYTGLLYLANAMLREASLPDESEDSDWDFYFRLCLTCYSSLYPCFRIIESMVKGLLSMAIRDDVLSAAEAKEIVNDLQQRGQHHSQDTIPSGDFIVDLDLSNSDPDAAMMTTLADSFQDLAMFGEFTTAEVMKKRKSKMSQDMSDGDILMDG